MTIDIFEGLAIVDAVDEAAGPDNVGGVAARMVGELDRDELATIATWWVTDAVRERRRARTYRSERTAEVVQPKPKREKWVPDEAFLAEERERDAQWRRELVGIMETYKSELRMEWTNELLDAGFSLPDGRVTTWGDATIDDHRQRAEMFMKQADAGLHGAARHQRAITDLTEGGAGCLRELMQT